MSDKRYLVLVDYTHGGFGFIVYAPNKKDLEKALTANSPDRGIEIIDRDIDEHPLVRYLGKRIESYKLDFPRGLLLTLMSE